MVTRIGNRKLKTRNTTFAAMSVIVENVTKLYGKIPALDNVSFKVDSGQVVGFLGPNGAGKSTMMKIITCFLPQTKGKVTVESFDVIDDPLNVRRQVGYLPEHNPLYLDMYVKEYLAFMAGLHLSKPVIGKRVDEMVEITGLGPEQKKKIGALSKGYRQRVGLAQAMIHNPKVLILDEPTSGLDPNQLREIRSLIKNIGREKTVILSTHIMQEVEAICNRVIIINKGKIVADDDTRILQQKTASGNHILVEFNKPASIPLLLTIPGVQNVENTSENMYRIAAIANTDIRQDLFKFAVDHQLAVITLQQESSSMESIFQQLTSEH